MPRNTKNLIEPINPTDCVRYGEKLTQDGRRLLDPYYEIPADKWSKDLSAVPFVTFPEIFVYCVLKTGYYTNQDMRAYRSLEAHNYFYNGFVQDIETAEAGSDLVFMKAKVLPSQRVGQKSQPYVAWVLSKKNGEVLTAHCTCMAGLDETCSHVAAILFKAQAAVILGLNRASCTSEACRWNSSFRKNVTASKISDIELTGPGGKRRKLAAAPQLSPSVNAQIDEAIRAFGARNGCVFMTSLDETGIVSSTSELPFLIAKMCDISRLSGCHAISTEFCEQFVKRMPAMFKPEQLADLETKTRDQSSSKLWFDHRHGRLTASLFGDVMAHMRTRTSNTSLLERICERQTVLRGKLCPPALKWGRDHEAAAIQLLMDEFSTSHTRASFERSGLIVNKEYPFLGASPDGMVTCECPGCPRKRVVEVKCPYSIRDRSPREAPYFDVNGDLSRDHKYYAQVQGEITLAGVSECLFVVFTQKGIHVQVVPSNASYVTAMFDTLKRYYVKEVLPAMLSG